MDPQGLAEAWGSDPWDPLEADPDDEGPFDLFTKDPKAQLHAILKGGGGVENVQRSGSGLDSL